jgi:YD repeat-containing protein
MAGGALALGLWAGLTSLLQGQNHDPVALQLLSAAPAAASEAHLDRYRLLTTPNLKPGAIYTLESVSRLGDGPPWTALEPIQARSNSLSYELMTPRGSNAFYRLRLPGPGLFRVEPSVVGAAGGAELYVVGQELGPNGQVRVGGATVPVEVVTTGGVYRCVAPALAEGVHDVEWLENGQVVARLAGALSVGPLPGGVTQRLFEPPAEPPASPQRRLLESIQDESKGFSSLIRREAIGDLNNDGCPDIITGRRLKAEMYCEDVRFNYSPASTFRMQAGLANAGNAIASGAALVGKAMNGQTGGGVVHGEPCGIFSGTAELQFQETDLIVPGVGLDFVFVRTYRSRTGSTTPMGHSWDHSYNLSIEAAGEDIAVRDGTGRRDVFRLQADGSYAADEFFCVGRWGTNSGNFIIEFPDTGTWEFYHFGVRPAGGKIARITDRNGNAIQFTYNLQDRLVEIVDTLGRAYALAYNADGLLSSLTDFAGRTWTYAYHDAGSTNGSSGDLASVTTPAVTNTPTGNDFPDGKTTLYAYTRGAADDRLNHNLTRITDSKGQTRLQVLYHTNTNPGSIEFDTVATLLRGIEKKDIRRSMVIARPDNRFAVVRTIVRDGAGNVTEYFCDSRNRLVTLREFTGRSDVEQPVTETGNRPTGKLRPEDPDWFETACDWNNDSLCTAVTTPAGDRLQFLYARDFNPAASPRKKGDLRVAREIPVAVGDLDGDGLADELAESVWRFEYDSRFGSPPEWLRGGASLGVIPVVQAHTIKTKNAAGGFRVSSTGWLVCDDAGDFVTRLTTPLGDVTTATYDERGNRRQTRTTERKSAAVIACDYDYDSLGRLASITHPADGEGRRRVDSFTYYTNGPMAGYLGSIRIDDGGLNLTTTFEYDARGNLIRLVDPRGLDTLYTWNAMDQLVARQTQGATFGERISTLFRYDANDNLVQVDHENRAPDGQLDPSNPHWTMVWQYDGLDRCVAILEEVAASPQPTWFTNEFEYGPNDNLARAKAITVREEGIEAPLNPLSAAVKDPPKTKTIKGSWDLAKNTSLRLRPSGRRVETVFTYDERDLLFTTVEAPGTGLAATNRWDYDLNGQVHRVSKIDALTIKQKVTENAMGEMRRQTDPMGNVTLFDYDRNHNLTRVRFHGETNDLPGSAGNRLLSDIRYEYDSLDRLVRVREAFFDVFTGAPLGDGEATTTFTWAPNGQLLSETDDNGNTTAYAYDSAGRRARATDAAGNQFLFSYDANGNVTLVRQIDRSDLGGPEQVFLRSFAYDARDRCVADWDNVGNTNRYAYDSRDLLVRVSDPRGNDACYQYDGLGRMVRSSHYAGSCDGGQLLSTSSFAYEVARLIAFTDGNSNVTRYAYDSRDRRVAVTNADLTVWQFTWDAFDNLAQVRDANGTVVTATYDLLDRCVRQDIAPGPGVAPATTFEAFAYDGRSLLVLASNDVSRAVFARNSLGQIGNAGQDEFACVAQHDALGNRLSLALPSGRVLTTTYDRLNRPTSLSLQTGGQVTPLATLAYEGPDRLGRVARGNGINTLLNWNGTIQPPNQPGDFGWQQILRINHALAQGGGVVDQRSYAYDRNQNKTARAQLVPFVPGGPLLTNRWDSDALDRLVQSVRETGGTQSFRQYQLDSNGNRQLVIENGLAQTYLMNTTLPEPADFQMNQYTVSPFGEYQYDANGNRTRWTSASGEFLYTYDYADRLVAVERMEGGVPAPVVSYTYDALGRRITRTVHQPPPLAPVTTRYIHDPDTGEVVEEWENGALRTTHVSTRRKGANEAAAIGALRTAATGKAIIPASGQVFHVLCDDLGNALALTDASGAVLERYDYDDFGQPAFLDANGDPLLDGSGVPVNRSQAGLDYLFGVLFWEPDLGIYLDEGSLAFDPQVAMPLARVGGGMPNRISMNVSVAKQTQGVDFGQRVNAGLQQAGAAAASGGTKQKKWLPSNFRLRIDGLDESCTRHGRKLLDRGEAGDNVGLLLRTAGSGAPGAGARIPLWKKVLNYVWEWDPWDPNGGSHNNNYAGVDR